MRTIAIMNNKGGVGKTITAINLADILVRDYHKRVLLMDCDGQMNLTRFYVPDFDPALEYSMETMLLGGGEPVWCDNVTPLSEGLSIVPASPGLYDLDLRAILDGAGNPLAADGFCRAARYDGDTDFIIFDCPPGYTLASVAALLAADEVVIPMLLDGFSFSGMLGMEEQLRSLRTVKEGARIAGVLVTQWHNSDVVRQGESLLRKLPVRVFDTVIRRTDKVPESTFERQPIAAYSTRSAAARDYRKWVREYLGEVL